MPVPSRPPVNVFYGEAIVAGEKAYVIKPKDLPNSSLRLIISIHGADGDELNIEPLRNSGTNFAYCSHIAAHGFCVVSSLWGGETWGNDAGNAKIDEAVAWAAAQGIPTSKIGFYTGSAGTTVAMNWFRVNPTKVGAVTLLVPACNLDNVYTDLTDQQADIDAAYGGNYSTNGLSHSPHRFAASLAGKAAGRVMYAEDDTLVRAADAKAFAQAIGWPYQDIGPGDHGALVNYVPDAADFVRIFENLKTNRI